MRLFRYTYVLRRGSKGWTCSRTLRFLRWVAVETKHLSSGPPPYIWYYRSEFAGKFKDPNEIKVAIKASIWENAFKIKANKRGEDVIRIPPYENLKETH